MFNVFRHEGDPDLVPKPPEWAADVSWWSQFPTQMPWSDSEEMPMYWKIRFAQYSNLKNKADYLKSKRK